MPTEPPSLESPPPREPWEEPPSAGWSSSLQRVGGTLARLVGSAIASYAAWRAAATAERLDQRHAAGWGHAGAVLLWILAAALVVGLVTYLVRSRAVLSLVAAILGDHGRIARLRGRPPVWLDAAPPSGALRLAHLSDLHIAEGDDVRLVERDAPAGNRRLRAILDVAAQQDLDLVLVTGDITDRGTAGAWRAFQGELERSGLADKTVLVPGNHDLALIDEIDTTSMRRERRRWARRALRADRFGLVQLANLLKFCDAFARTGGGRRGVVLATSELPPGDGKVVPYRDAWRVVAEEVRPLVEALPTLAVPRVTLRHPLRERDALRAYEARIDKARARLMSMFPVAVPLAERDAVLYVLNSSSRVAHHAAANAIGHLGRAQHRRLERLAELFAQPLQLVAVHHHLVRRGEELSADLVHRLMARFAVLGDASRLVSFCRRQGVRAVLNGHRHLSYQLRLPGGCVLLAAASTTLGDELTGDLRPQFDRYEIAQEADPRSTGMVRTVVRLPGSELVAASRPALAR